MRADAHARPVGAVDVAGDGIAVLQYAADELVHQMGVGAAVAAALQEGQMRVAVVVHRLAGEAPDLRRQAVRVVGHRDALLRHQPTPAVVV